MKDRELPQEFLDKMKDLLGQADFGEYLESFHKPAFEGLRFNSLKLKNEEESFHRLLREEFGNLKQVPWVYNGFYYDQGSGVKPARHPYYYGGLYYLQEPSAMTPATLLPVEPGDSVLDLCAAPGGKSTELAARLEGRGFLLSNDLSSSRAKALLKNLELFGVGNCCVASETPEKLAQHFDCFFDKILVDAPCSGEGMFRRDRDMAKAWLLKGPAYYAALQRDIVFSAIKMLKPGGMLLYSTCTFDKEENEGTIRHILDSEPDMELIELQQKPGFEPGFDLPGCVRLFPHKIDGEGHFMALLKKSGAAKSGKKEKTLKGNYDSLKKEEKEGLCEFLGHISRSFEQERIYVKNNCVYYLPAELLTGSGDRLFKIRYLRTGLFLGEFKNSRFEPSQALAMNLYMAEFDHILSFPCEDERVIRYLKGESISLLPQERSDKNGWCLVGVDGFPLGFAKHNGGLLKNKYYPGWRWQ